VQQIEHAVGEHDSLSTFVESGGERSGVFERQHAHAVAG
jgi:hypothetical protein